MVKFALIIWITGLFTIVPYGLYDLFFYAQREEYAFLITMVLFWLLGYWAVVGPIISAIKVRQLFNAMEQVKSKEELKELLISQESQELFIEQLASENKIPKFIAKKLVTAVISKLPDQGVQ